MGRNPRSQIVASAGGGGGGLTSAGAPAVPGLNSSGATTISPVNWAGAAGDAFLMGFMVESFASGGANGTWSFTPTEGEVIGYAEANDGTTFFTVGLWWIPSYSGVGNPNLTPSCGGGTIGICLQNIWYWDALVTQPTQIVVQNEFAAMPANGSPWTGADGGTWSSSGTILSGPAIEGIAAGTDWFQGRVVGLGDEGVPTDTDAYYDVLSEVNTTGGTDGTIISAYKNGAAAVMGDGVGRITHEDVGSALFAIGALNFLIGT